MKFSKLEDYQKQQQQAVTEQQAFIEREQEAQEEVARLKREYEHLITNGATGKKAADFDKKADELATKIDEAVRRADRRQKERNIHAQSRQQVITGEDVQQAFLNEFRPAFRAEKIDPLAEKLAQLKSDYYKTVFEYLGAVDEFEWKKREVIGVIGEHYRYRLGNVKIDDQSGQRAAFIKESDLRHMYRGRLAESYQLLPVEEEEVEAEQE